MTLENILLIVNENKNMYVWDNGEIVASYDGRDSIPDFGAYTVIEPTEPVTKIQTINICRKPVQMNRTQHKQISHKSRKKVEKELNYSAYMTTAVTFFSIVGMLAWWVAVGY